MGEDQLHVAYIQYLSIRKRESWMMMIKRSDLVYFFFKMVVVVFASSAIVSRLDAPHWEYFCRMEYTTCVIIITIKNTHLLYSLYCNCFWNNIISTDQLHKVNLQRDRLDLRKFWRLKSNRDCRRREISISLYYIHSKFYPGTTITGERERQRQRGEVRCTGVYLGRWWWYRNLFSRVKSGNILVLVGDRVGNNNNHIFSK